MPTRDADSISSSLLVRVRGSDAVAWRRLVDLFSPLIYHWARRAGLDEADAADVVQDVFAAVHGRVGAFDRDREGGTFRGWLRTITRHKVGDCQRKHWCQPAAEGGTDALARLNQTAAPADDGDDDPAADAADIAHRGLELVAAEFTEKTWAAFHGTALDGRPADEVARELGMSLGAVYIARTRVFKRLREELQGLL